MTLDSAKIFLDRITEVQAVHIIKTKNFYASEDTTKNLKRQPTQWKKILANPLFDKGYPEYRKNQPIQLNNKDKFGASLAVQWLRLLSSYSRVCGFSP